MSLYERRGYNKATTFKKHRQAELQMLYGKTVLAKKIIDQTRKQRTPSIKCLMKPEQFISCMTAALSGLFL